MVTRRRVLRTGLTTVAAVSGTAAALRPMLAADDRRPGAGPPAAGPPAAVDEAPAVPLFDEVYRGRRIQGFSAASEDRVALYVDGRPLHTMRRADGSWISVADHFQPYPTPVATARGAVDAIGGAELAAWTGHHH